MPKTVRPFRQNRLGVSPWPIYPKWTSWGVKCPFDFFFDIWLKITMFQVPVFQRSEKQKNQYVFPLLKTVRIRHTWFFCIQSESSDPLEQLLYLGRPAKINIEENMFWSISASWDPQIKAIWGRMREPTVKLPVTAGSVSHGDCDLVWLSQFPLSFLFSK